MFFLDDALYMDDASRQCEKCGGNATLVVLASENIDNYI